MIEGKRFSEVPETVKLPMARRGARSRSGSSSRGTSWPEKWQRPTASPRSARGLRVGPGNADGTNSNDKKRVGTQQGTVDANGTFRVEGVPEGPLNVDVMLENVSSAKKTNIAHDTADLEIELPAMAGIAGTVVDSTSGTPIKAFVVTLVTQRDAEQSNNRYWGWNPGQERPQVSETGAFEIGGIAPETYIVRVTADAYTQGETKDVVVKAGEMIRGLTIPLIPGAVISGKVVDALNGQPIPAAEIELVNADEQDNGIRFPGEKVRSDGRFEMRGLKAMRARIVAHHESSWRRPPRPWISIPASGSSFPQ